MSSNLPTPPQDSVSKKTEELTNFVRLLVRLIQSRDWFKLLLLFEAVLILFGTPGGVVPKFLETLGLKLPKNYPIFFWLIVGVVFVAAIIVALRTQPQQKKIVDASERKAIKGLRPFSFNFQSEEVPLHIP